MKPYLPVLRSLLLIAIASLATAPRALENGSSWPPCNDIEVEYKAAGAETLAKKIVVRKLKRRPAAVQDEKDREYKPLSPQQTAAFNRTLVADTTKPETHNEAVQIFTLSGKSAAWEIRTFDVHDSAELLWLNDELIFMRIWWGRIRSTDLIFQIKSGKFIYAKDASYGELTSPCHD